MIFCGPDKVRIFFSGPKKSSEPRRKSFSFLDSKFFFRARNPCEKFFREYLFKLIEEGIVQQQNCLKIGRNLCHDYGR